MSTKNELYNLYNLSTNLGKFKYVDAFQDSMHNFNIRFLKQKGLQQIEVGNDLSNFFKLIDGISEKASKTIDFYKQHKITIGAVSRLLGRSLFDIWVGLISNQDFSLLCASGTIEEQKEEISTLNTSQSIIIDLIGLFTVAHLECFDIVSKLFKEIYISQSSLDEIMQLIAMQILYKEKGYRAIGKHKEKYVREEATAEAIQENIECLNKIKDFITNKTTVIGLKKPISFSEIRLQSLLGDSSIDSLIIAKENSLSLYSDDKLLRELANNEYKLKGFCIQNILQKALNDNLLQEEDYNDKVIKLVLSNYSYISISGKVLIFSLKRNNFNLTREVLLLFQIIESVNTSLRSALDVLSDFIKTIWLERIGDREKLKWLDKSLYSLTNKRGIRNTLGLFKSIINKKMNLLPIHTQAIQKNINIWINSKPVMF